MKKIAELCIAAVEDRMTVAGIFVKNGYNVGPGRRKKTPTGKSYDYLLKVYKEEESDADE